MATFGTDIQTAKRRSGVFGDLLIIALVIAGWFLLQAVILPRLGVST